MKGCHSHFQTGIMMAMSRQRRLHLAVNCKCSECGTPSMSVLSPAVRGKARHPSICSCKAARRGWSGGVAGHGRSPWRRTPSPSDVRSLATISEDKLLGEIFLTLLTGTSSGSWQKRHPSTTARSDPFRSRTQRHKRNEIPKNKMWQGQHAPPDKAEAGHGTSCSARRGPASA